ncbi:MAG: response regulator [Chloroflexota bacterium]
MPTKILVVDDEPDLELLINLQFEDRIATKDFEFIFAQDGLDALNKLQTAPDVDIVLSDINMPRMDGLSLLSNLTKNHPTLSTIIISAYSDMRNIRLAMNFGAFDFITKPINFEDLEITIDKTIRHTQQIKEAANATQLRIENRVLEKQAQVLEKLNADKDKFFSIVAHDLRGPFLPLLGHAEGLYMNAEKMSIDDIRLRCGYILKAGRKVFELLDNLLAWGTLQMGGLTHTPYPLNLYTMIDTSVALFAETADEKQITLKNMVDQNLMVYSDKNMFHTIMRNLISNALKFTRPQGSVTIVAEAHPTRESTEDNSGSEQLIEVSVIDTGVGINPDDLEKIFRLDIDYSTKGTAGEPGTGLGLIISKEMVDLNQGEIWLELNDDGGTTFKFTLPAHQPMADAS